MTETITAHPAPAASADLYRAVWRWHFYAGLIVLPFLILLAVTGALYLFRDELDALVHADLKRVEASEARASPSVLVSAAIAAHPGRATKLVTPATDTATAEVQMVTDSGKLAVYLDPHTGRVLGSLPDGGTFMGVVRDLHSLELFGPVANGVLEAAAGWAILLVCTGIYLWWPRRSGGGVVTVRGRPRTRLFWRDLHAVTGAFAGIFIVFLALSGLPWSIFWGNQFGAFVDARGLGFPPGVWSGIPVSDAKLADLGPTGWTAGRSPVPVSHAPAGSFGIDAAVAKFTALGLSPGFAVDLPDAPTDVFTGSVFPDDVALQRIVHLDRTSCAVLLDAGYGGYGPVAKATEWGISVHMGQEFGRVNQFVMLAACMAILLLCVSAAIMWWMRRPAGGIGVPPMPKSRARFAGVVAILAAGGVLFPLTGASFLAMFALDIAVRRFRT